VKTQRLESQEDRDWSEGTPRAFSNSRTWEKGTDRPFLEPQKEAWILHFERRNFYVFKTPACGYLFWQPLGTSLALSHRFVVLGWEVGLRRCSHLCVSSPSGWDVRQNIHPGPWSGSYTWRVNKVEPLAPQLRADMLAWVCWPMCDLYMEINHTIAQATVFLDFLSLMAKSNPNSCVETGLQFSVALM
jgi:hypothetical protein